MNRLHDICCDTLPLFVHHAYAYGITLGERRKIGNEAILPASSWSTPGWMLWTNIVIHLTVDTGTIRYPTSRRNNLRSHGSHGERRVEIPDEVENNLLEAFELRTLGGTSVPPFGVAAPSLDAPLARIASSIELSIRSSVPEDGRLIDNFLRRMGCMSRTLSRVQVSANQENFFSDILADYTTFGY